MLIYAIGDVVGNAGCQFLRSKLPTLKKNYGIRFVVANGENSSDGNGITPASAKDLFDSGVDVVTTGNHAFRRRECYPFFDSCETLLRPANFPDAAPGHGVCIYDRGSVQIAVINVMGTVYMENMDCPFATMDRLLKKELPKIVLVDFHAEATGEKRALGYYLNGKVSAVFGTHTHVPTADACILPGGTGYISDLGMTGPIDSVLGVKPELVIEKLRTKMPVRFDFAAGPCKMDGALLDIDEKTGRCRSVQPLCIS